MPQDKFTAVWTSHTSINDFLTCPRGYYLKHVYKDPESRHKVKIMSPALALGSAVHGVLESLSVLPKEHRLKIPLVERLEETWKNVAGLKGGFLNDDVEFQFKKQAQEMLARVQYNPGPLVNPAVKIQKELPYFWLSDEDNIILCGKVDWLEYLPDKSVHIIDFKTGKNEEAADSLQLPIYCLLVKHTQEWPVTKASYWYLTKEDGMVEKPLPDVEQAREQILTIARDMKLARQLQRFKCSQGDGCFSCKPYEKVIKGEARFVGVGEYDYDIYVIEKADEEKSSVIL